MSLISRFDKSNANIRIIFIETILDVVEDAIKDATDIEEMWLWINFPYFYCIIYNS